MLDKLNLVPFGTDHGLSNVRFEWLNPQQITASENKKA
jgi:hypothetical protein